MGTAAVTPGLEKMAIAGDGEAGLFEIATGQRISRLPQFSAVNFTDSSSAFLLTPQRRPEPTWGLEYLIDRVDAHQILQDAERERLIDGWHRSLSIAHRLIEVLHQVLDVFQPDREAHQPIGDAGGLAGQWPDRHLAGFADDFQSRLAVEISVAVRIVYVGGS